MSACNELTWKPIPNFSMYEASNAGTIRNIKTNKILTTKPNSSGYIRNAMVDDDGNKVAKYAHIIICLAFYGSKPDNMTVDHIDRNKLNNMSENLRWASLTTQNINKLNPKERAGYPIWQLDPKTKEKIKRFENSYRAAEHLNRPALQDGPHIGDAAKKKRLRYGFYWEFEKIEEIVGEIWTKISRNEKEFYISNYGRIKGVDDHNRLANVNVLQGYLTYESNKKKFLVHRLVAETYLENLDNLQIVNHKDCNKSNNCVENLEWVTRSENGIHAWKNGRHNG
jgi:hypothetical protein